MEQFSDFSSQLHKEYNVLYKHIFRLEVETIKELLYFLNIQCNYVTLDKTYNEIWDYIVANEDKHDWWIL